MMSRIQEITELFDERDLALCFPEILKLDEINWNYYLTLVRARKNGKKPLVLFQKDLPLSGERVAYPTAIAPAELLKYLPVTQYADLVLEKSKYKDAAKKAFLWVRKMHAGTGSSLNRVNYLAKMHGIKPSEVVMGAKGVDLRLSVNGQTRSLAEIQILHGVNLIQSGGIGAVCFHEMVSPDTKQCLRKIWEKPWSYVTHFGETVQESLPTLDEKLKPSLNRMAPGGHAFAAFDALLACADNGARPKIQDQVLVGVIGNGEDLSSTPDPVMIGWMIREKIPLVMITTDKTPVDLKGGLISLAKEKAGKISLTIFEQAQAKASGQLELFEKIGLEIKENGQSALFNTNVALFNYEILIPKISALIRKIGTSEFLNIISPDLIENWKTQKDGKYLQLEGAMGSTLLNLDSYWRTHFGEPLVHFVNVDQGDRTRFFSPIKNAFDFFMQFHSDRFSLDTKTMTLVNHRPGRLPIVNLNSNDGTYYQDLQNVLDIFSETKIIDLDKLDVQGKVDFSGVVLKGDVKISNTSDKVLVLKEKGK